MLRDALVLAAVPLVAAAIGLFALIQTHNAWWLALLVESALLFSLWEWGGITSAPWHTISKYAQVYRWLYWVIAGLAAIPLLLGLNWGLAIFTALLIAEVIFQLWWRHHIFHSVIPRLPE